MLSPKEKAETDKKKQEGSKKGKQFVSNTPVAAKARKKAAKTTAAPNKKSVPARKSVNKSVSK